MTQKIASGHKFGTSLFIFVSLGLTKAVLIFSNTESRGALFFCRFLLFSNYVETPMQACRLVSLFLDHKTSMRLWAATAHAKFIHNHSLIGRQLGPEHKRALVEWAVAATEHVRGQWNAPKACFGWVIFEAQEDNVDFQCCAMSDLQSDRLAGRQSS